MGQPESAGVNEATTIARTPLTQAEPFRNTKREV